ncbi:aspartate aminotransferase family protein [Pikeienuella piscinae]|uniref:Aspartate aminotransferase family protein n=1 Tax=Pikeienuella piscinae TaxID=2748098 RepID=A0A7L5BX21_9RHOB|nr:aspartate aminotransferase family protein [Pikeienuella piscinae]QIE55991.1 aspartate aminotransferase family protein [Pikeienuella piscinae]
MADLYARDAAALSRMSHLRFFPQAVTGGEGCWLTSDDGRKLLDFSGSWGAVGLGHAHPAVREAVARALSSQAGASLLSSATLPAVELAERLLSIAPRRARGRVWLGHSGSDANETVARAVLAATGRTRIIAFEGGYHGGTVGSVAVSGHPVQDASARLPGLSLIPFPNPLRDGGPEAAAENSLARLRAVLDADGADVAAMFIEPIQSDGGMLVAPDGYFREVEALCRPHGVLLVCDEVKVGLARSGRLHCFEHLGVEPDIVVFGKALGGGLPLSAVVGPEAVMNHAAAFSFQTLHGNPACAAAGLAVLETIAREGLAERAAETGDYLAGQLRALRDRHPGVVEIRGHGLALGMELATGDDLTPATEQAALSVFRAHQLGLVLYYVGVNSNVLEFTPPLTLERSEVDLGVEILDRAMRDVAAGEITKADIAGFEGW